MFSLAAVTSKSNLPEDTGSPVTICVKEVPKSVDL